MYHTLMICTYTYENGVYTHSGKPIKKYIVDHAESTSEVIITAPVGDDSVSEYLTLGWAYYCHQGTSTFHRQISYVVDSKCHTVQYIQYLAIWGWSWSSCNVNSCKISR